MAELIVGVAVGGLFVFWSSGFSAFVSYHAWCSRWSALVFLRAADSSGPMSAEARIFVELHLQFSFSWNSAGWLGCQILCWREELYLACNHQRPTSMLENE